MDNYDEHTMIHVIVSSAKWLSVLPLALLWWQSIDVNDIGT